jgi:phosphoribosylglycinamide formyltransferase-1
LTRKRVGVLISGRGSNLQALVDAAQAPDYPAEILLVISNVPGAQGLARADEAGIAALAINHKDFASREDFDTVLNETLKQAQIDILCNAGFLRLQPGFVRAWYNRHLNIHPPFCLPSRACTPMSGSLPKA